MSKKNINRFDDIQDEFAPSELEHVVGGRGPIGHSPLQEDTLLHGGLDAHTTSEPSVHHHVAAPSDTPAHHVDLHGWSGLTGSSIDETAVRLDQAFAELTTNHSEQDVQSHIALGRALTSHISNGHHPYTFQGIEADPIAHIPQGPGPTVHQSHLPDHRGGAGNSTRTASANPSPRTTSSR